MAAVAAALACGAGATVAEAAAPRGPWDRFNLSPATRTVEPVSVLRTGGTVSDARGALDGRTTTLAGAGSYVTFDFGKEVGGFVRLRFGSDGSPGQTVGLTFSESSVYVDPARSDASNGGSNDEPALEYPVPAGGTVDMREDPATAGTPAPVALSAPGAAGDTRLDLTSTSGLFAGTNIFVGEAAAREEVKITSLQPEFSTTLSSPAAPGDTTVELAGVGGDFVDSLAAGDDLLIGLGEQQEARTITAVGAQGDRTVTLDAPLTRAHAAGAAAVRPSRMTVAPALRRAHPAGAAVAVGPEASQRGGFRYLTVVNRSGGSLRLKRVALRLTFAPHMRDLRSYDGYFHSDDDLINRIWYAGAYTVQTNIIKNDEGRVWPAPAVGWNNNALVGELGETVLVDGPKRDRTVWPGDLGISVPVDYVSLGDMATIRNSLQTLFNHQNAFGALPFAGPAVNYIGLSDTYHLWTMLGTHTYYQYTRDRAWVDSVWSRYKAALAFITTKIGADDLLDVTSTFDWARSDAEGKQIQAQAILYRTLQGCRTLATVQGEPTLAASCAAKAAALKAAVSDAGYWDAQRGLYRNYPAGTPSHFHPQDGNGLALWYGLVDSSDKAAAISAALEERWTPVGAQTPEKGPRSVHPFAGGMEVFGHLAAGESKRALDLMRLEWGYMLDAPQGTASTFWEGYRTDGSSDYSGSYQSLAHGWSAAPTAALTYYVLGIRPDDDGGLGYSLVPDPGDLQHVEGRLKTPRGTIGHSYDVDRGARTFRSRYRAPARVLDRVAVPTFGVPVKVKLDGRTVWNGHRATGGSSARLVGDRVVLDGDGGSHSIVVTPKGDGG